jgi:signal transduction histidine kinase/CheY-like chemotaxis protein
MRAEVLLALNRSFAHCCESGMPSLQRLLASLAQEILLLVAPEVVGVAALVTVDTGRPIVGQARHGVCLSEESLVWLSESCRNRKNALVVKDHSLEPLTYTAAALRTSVVVQLAARVGKGKEKRVLLWFGSDSVVTTRELEKLQRVASAVSEWIESSVHTIETVLAIGALRGEYETYRNEVISCAHDIRAALGALRYRRSLTEPGEIGRSEDEVDLAYIESLLARFGPKGRSVEEIQQVTCASVYQLVERVVERWKASAQRSGVRLIATCTARDTHVSIDPIELERALTNVIGNAIKHSQGSEVRIETQRVQSELLVHVLDNGRGFPVNVLNALRSRTQQLQPSGTGWGVGLKSTKDRLDAAGGSLVVSSRDSGGSVVTLSLPIVAYETVEDSPLLQLQESSAHGLYSNTSNHRGDVWLVDDDKEHSESLGRVVARYGISTRSFSSLADVMKELECAHPASIICDINMPDGGGKELLSRLGASHHSIPIAIMSGESDETRLYRLAAAGAQAFFSKPVDIEPLVEWVLECACSAERAAS